MDERNPSLARFLRSLPHVTRGESNHCAVIHCSPMKVGIDGRSLAAGRARRGVAHYTASLAEALAAGFPGDSWRLLVPGATPDPPVAGVETAGLRLPSRVVFGAAALAGRPRLDRLLGGAADVVWAPAPAPLAVSPGVPFVLTVHDLSFEEDPRFYTRYERAWHRLGRLGRLARRAERVIAVSAATREAALARWGLDPDRVVVVPSGVDRPSDPPGVAEEIRHDLGVPERYLLFVGALEPRKAPVLLARAYAATRAGGLDADLVVVGTGRLESEMGGPGVRLLGGRDRREVEALYAGALAVVLPSFSEGYGWPPLEAAACGTPSVVTDLPVFRETLGDAALRVAPGDEDALAQALARIASDAALRERLAADAALAIADRTWEAAARATHGVLAAAAGA